MPFQVGGTKKGGMPVTTEKRPRGKTVTLISNVRGDKGELIQMLKHALGCGGRAVAHDKVEIQGDHADAIQGLLLRHVGVGAMRGVAGLKPPKPDPAELASELHETARRQARAKSEEALAAERRRRLEQRQRAIREAVPAKHENTREFHAFASMMKRWRYWDQDYARLDEMHHRHLRQLDEADARRAGAGFLDADLDDNDDMQTGPKSTVLDAMRRDLDALNGTRATDAKHEDARAALDALGMIASPSPFRQTREERLAESKRNAAVARARAAAEATRSTAATRSAAADDRYAAGGAGASRAWSRPPVGGDSTSSAAAAASTSFAAAASRSRSHVSSRGGRGGRSSRGRGMGAGFARVGAHGKGDASRPSLGYTAARKRGGDGGYGYDREDEDDYRDESFDDDDDDDDDDSFSFDGDARVDEGGERARARARARVRVGSSSFEPGWTRDSSGGFSFGPIPGASTFQPPDRSAATDETDEDDAWAPDARVMDQEESDLREALRRSLLETESARASSSGPVGLHVECDEVWGELTEEEALALAMDLSEQQERRDREMRAEVEAVERYYRHRPSELDGFGGGGFDDASVHPDDETGDGARDRIDSVDADFANEGEDAELREALRLSALHAEAEATRREAFVEHEHSGMMPASMDEDAALEAALRLSALEVDGGASRAEVDISASPRVDANADVLQWAAAQLSAFTGEAENDVLAEYLVSMGTAAEVEEFVAESFGDSADAAAFARALEGMRAAP
jgi:translation initiation factor 1 (eIF-1/SUI1)